MGDNSGVAMNVDDATMPQAAVARRDGIFSALGTGLIYTLTVAGQPFDRNACGSQVIIDGIHELDPEGLQTRGNHIPLSGPITMPCNGVLIAAGLDFVLLAGPQKIWEIAIPSGVTTGLSSQPLAPSPQYCENWAAWGVAERWGGRHLSGLPLAQPAERDRAGLREHSAEHDDHRLRDHAGQRPVQPQRGPEPVALGVPLRGERVRLSGQLRDRRLVPGADRLTGVT